MTINPSLLTDSRKRWLTASILTLTLITFFCFGLFHLGKFETTDEHLWKYDRIGAYWEALSNGEWEKTYINDKPGITVALISGIGLLKEPHPEQNVNAVRSDLDTSLFEAYNVPQSEPTNITFRLPVLLFSTLALLGFYLLLQSAFASRLIALLGTIFIATNPILLGISQIINPDSFFWIFGGLSMLAYIALIRTEQRKFLFLCGILTGFALLSKYTAFTLFLFYGLYLMGKYIFQETEVARTSTLSALLRHILDIVIIALLALGVFALFLPAVFVQPELLFKGISQFFSAKNSVLLLGATATVSLLLFFLRNKAGEVAHFLAAKRFLILSLVTGAFLFLVALSLANVWTGERLVPVDALRDQAYANEPKEFNFKPLLDRKDSSWQVTAQLFLMEAHPLVFSLSPLVFILIALLLLQSQQHKISNQTAAFAFSALLFTLLYLCSTLFAQVVTNARYLIVLYPLLAILSAVLLSEFLKNRPKLVLVLPIVFLILGILTLFVLRPFYFSYTNSLLPLQFTVHDSWGHGSYEAATYLNSLPDAQNLVIWSNSDTVCRFFVGKCLKSRRINLARVTPDYFVVSKRGAIKTSNRFLLENNPTPEKDSDYYFRKLEESPLWQLSLNDRPGNFIKIISFEK